MGWFLADGSWGPQLELTKAPSCRTSNLLEVGFGIEKIWDAEKNFSQLDMQSQELGQEQADALAAVVGYLELTNQSIQCRIYHERF